MNFRGFRADLSSGSGSSLLSGLGLGLGARLAADYARGRGWRAGPWSRPPTGSSSPCGGLGGQDLGGLRFGLVPLFRLVLLPGRGLLPARFRRPGRQVSGGGVGASAPAPLLAYAEYLVELVKIILHFPGVLPSNVFAAAGILWLRRCEPAPAPPRTGSDSSPRPPPARGRARVNHIARRKVD